MFMKIKKIAAVLLLLALCLGLCSCGYNPKTVGTVTDPEGRKIDITCGQYLIAQYESLVSILNSAGASGQIDLVKLLDTEYEGGTIRDYIRSRLPDILLRRAVTDYLYDKTDLGDDTATKIYYDNYIQNDWASNSNSFLQNGIGFDSFRNYELQMLKAAQIPYVLYGKGGEQELSEEYVNDFIAEKCGRFTYISLPYRKVMDVGLTDEEKKELKSYAEQILAACEAEGIPAHGSAKNVIASAAQEFTVKYQSMLGYEQEMESITYDYQRRVIGDGTFTEAQYEQMFKAAPGEFVLVDGGDGLYIIAYRSELDPEEDTYDKLFNEAIVYVAGEQFQSYVEEKAKGFSIELDPKAVEYYSPDKIVFSR